MVNYNLICMTFICFLLFVNITYGLGVVTDYGSEKMYITNICPNCDCYVYKFRVQNNDNVDKDIIVVVNSDYNIAKIEDYKYTVKKKTSLEIPIYISLPILSYKNGDYFQVSYLVTEKSTDIGNIVLNRGISKEFKIIIGEEGQEPIRRLIKTENNKETVKEIEEPQAPKTEEEQGSKVHKEIKNIVLEPPIKLLPKEECCKNVTKIVPKEIPIPEPKPESPKINTPVNETNSNVIHNDLIRKSIIFIIAIIFLVGVLVWYVQNIGV